MIRHSISSNGIVTITLSNPGRLNALTASMGNAFQSLISNLNSTSSDSEFKDARAVIITGADSAFSSGGDLHFLLERTTKPFSENVATMREFYSRFLSMRSLRIPTIAAVNGHAVGAGLCLALACDMRIMLSHPKVKLGVNFANLGIHAGMGATHYLPQVARPDVAMNMLTTGRLLRGDEVMSQGLATAVADSEEGVWAAANEIAEKVASADRLSVESMVKTVRMRMDVGLDAALEREAVMQAVCYEGEAFKNRLLKQMEHHASMQATTAAAKAATA
jgi:enoyl-CoA hydratase/carnithine racemase